jgi:glycosyltransferase involved in cell wall biosynthesis
MAQKLIERGHQVTILCGTYKTAETGLEGDYVRGCRSGTINGIDVIEFHLPYSNADNFLKRALTFLRFAWQGVILALTSQYDLVFCTSTPLTAGIPGIFARLLRLKPFVFEVRDLWPELPREMGVIKNPVVLWAMGILEWCSYHAATGCIGLSPGISQGIVRRGIEKSRVVMIPNGCDLNLFYPDRSTGKRPAEIQTNDLVAIFSGAHGMANGLDAVLDAALELKQRDRNDIKLVFVGDGRLKPGLLKRAESEGLTNCIFLDPIPKPELAALVRGADVGLMILANVPAFYYGTSPNKFFDYIASGLPVLNNYPGWLAGMITENRCGIAVPPDDARAFAEALIHLADHPEERKAMEPRARSLAEREFDRDKLADSFVDWLEKMVAK